jgi:hypothetical protein
LSNHPLLTHPLSNKKGRSAEETGLMSNNSRYVALYRDYAVMSDSKATRLGITSVEPI